MFIRISSLKSYLRKSLTSYSSISLSIKYSLNVALAQLININSKSIIASEFNSLKSNISKRNLTLSSKASSLNRINPENN